MRPQELELPRDRLLEHLADVDVEMPAVERLGLGQRPARRAIACRAETGATLSCSATMSRIGIRSLPASSTGRFKGNRRIPRAHISLRKVGPVIAA
jgi:hypothetical protein